MSEVKILVTTTKCRILGGPPCKVKLGTARSSINENRGLEKGSKFKTQNGRGNQRTGREPRCVFINSVDEENIHTNLDFLEVAPKYRARVGRGKYFTGVDSP